MNKVGLSMCFLVALLAATAFASAEESIVLGKIYTPGFTETVAGADIIVVCNGIPQTAISRSDGAYGVNFNQTCPAGSNYTVFASKGTDDGFTNGVMPSFLIGVANIEISFHTVVINVGSGGRVKNTDIAYFTEPTGEIALVAAPAIVVEEEQPVEEVQQTSRSSITGGVIGAISSGPGISIILLVLLISAVTIYIVRSRKY